MNKSMRRQAGNMLITTLLALVIASVFALVKVRENIIDQKRATGIGEAKLLSTLANGVNTLIANEWLDFQNGSTVTYNSVSVVPSTVSGVTTWSPTIAQLQSMGLPTTGWTATTSSITSGALTVTIMRTPSGCSGTACSVVGYVYAAAPYLNNNASGTTDSVVVGAMLTQLGTDGGVSLPTSTSTITGYASSWTYANPVTSSPAGVVAVQVGVSSAAYAQFVRIGDTRDPSLQGALTVAGATTLKSTLGVTGTTTLASTLNVTGATAMASTLGVAGAATLSSTLGVSGASTLTGAVSGGSTATFASRVKGQMLASSTTAAAGASCSGYSEGDTVLDATTTGTVLTCRSSVWVRPGLPVGAIGGACTTGTLGVTTANVGLICRNAVYVSLSDRVASLVPMGLYPGTGVGTVAAPTCGTGGSVQIVVTPQETGSDTGGTPVRNRFSFVISYASSTWTISPVLIDSADATYTSDFSGTAYGFNWVATTFCSYGAGA